MIRRLSSKEKATKDGSEDTIKKSDLLQVSVINGNGKRRGSYTVTIVPGRNSVDTNFGSFYKFLFYSVAPQKYVKFDIF